VASNACILIKFVNYISNIIDRVLGGLIDLTKLVTAVSELARNTVVYGGGGYMDWEIVERDLRSGVRLTFRDEGPGIPDIKLAMTDGWTSGGGLGLGLTGAKRLVDEFELDTAPGQGTRVTITRWS
jgi:serine/threonine-protein kinase RsbT